MQVQLSGADGGPQSLLDGGALGVGHPVVLGADGVVHGGIVAPRRPSRMPIRYRHGPAQEASAVSSAVARGSGTATGATGAGSGTAGRPKCQPWP